MRYGNTCVHKAEAMLAAHQQRHIAVSVPDTGI